jgi:sugar phosphate isomerase/epimerase
MKLGIQEEFNTGFSYIEGENLAEKFEELEKLGFEGVEIWGWNINKRFKEIKSAFSVSKIKCSTMCSGYKGDLLGSDRTSRELAIKEIKERLKICADLDCLGLVTVDRSMDFSIGAYPRIKDLWPWISDVREIGKKVLIEECKILGKYAEDVGSYVILEPITRHYTDFLHRLDQAVEICEATGSDNVKIMADFYHMNIEEPSISESLDKAADYIVHVHLKDSNTELPGRGHMNFQEGLNVLRKNNYKDYLTLECEVPSLEALIESVEFLKKII